MRAGHRRPSSDLRPAVDQPEDLTPCQQERNAGWDLDTDENQKIERGRTLTGAFAADPFGAAKAPARR